MKIEMGESLMLSWLRHAKNCQIVQLNWKPSTTSWELHNENDLEIIIEKTSDFFRNQFNLDVFKSNTYSQLLKQAEIDALGLEFNNEQVENIYGIDIAFHENGLNYRGGKDEIIARVIKKMIRTAMIIYGYFNFKKGQIIFASPKINNSTYVPLEKCVDALNDFIEKMGFQFMFRLYGNEKFKEKIFMPVINLSSSIADTSELFMRSIQMYNLFKEDKTSKIILKDKTHVPKGSEEIKIGLLVRSTVKKLAESNAISEHEIDNLIQYNYSKSTFDLNYPFLKKIKKEIPILEQRKVNEYYRYWSEIFTINGEKYIACNDWYEKNRLYFMEWLENIKKSHGLGQIIES